MKPVVLCILDGWGLSDSSEGNAPLLADTATLDEIQKSCPTAKLITHGPDVGLPTGQMGNSEVGHTNIGAGRVVAMDLGQIDLAIESGDYAKNSELLKFAKDVKTAGGDVHLLSVLSDGGVHGHIDHLIATAHVLADQGLSVLIHAITDGRDVAPQSALEYLDQVETALPKGAQIVTVAGRYYALDRDNRWDRVALAYKTFSDANGPRTDSVKSAIKNAYATDITDEFIVPTVVGDYQGFKENDGVFCLNFRADRAREIMAAIAKPGFSDFETGPRKGLSAVMGMVSYSAEHDTYLHTTFPKRKLINTLGAWVAQHGKRQFRLAETEKYPHVTFFLNGGVEPPYDAEDRFMPASPKVATYDLKPEMSSLEVTDRFVQAIGDGYDLIVTNYANPDMVGHTGDLGAAITACEAVDRGLKKVIEALKAAGGTMIVTADHGNCEVMIDPETKGPHTAHTTNLVPIMLVNGPKGVMLNDGRLADLAPTLLELMGLPQPDEMTGVSLLK